VLPPGKAFGLPCTWGRECASGTCTCKHPSASR
jgi:hypothetical protein